MQLRLFDLRTLKPVVSVKTDDEIWGVTFYEQGQSLCTAGKDKHIHMWDLNLTPLAHYKAHRSSATACFASPTENSIGSVAQDGYMRLWVAKP